ncbi:hypothetical protein HMPREF1548_04302 [Clostridium sp. KLE 1755]|nr:hypothetical protein HMPREF1548_04302 [Clostridium sp. KLE 1755]
MINSCTAVCKVYPNGYVCLRRYHHEWKLIATCYELLQPLPVFTNWPAEELL